MAYNVAKGNTKTKGALVAAGTAAAIAASGGAAAPAIIGAGTTGASLGGMAFGMAGPSPSQSGSQQAIQRRVQLGQQTQVDPQATMRQAISALKQANNPELTRQYAPILVQGMVKTMGA